MRPIIPIIALILALTMTLLFASPVDASLVTIDKKGKVVINVLSAEESIEVEIPRSEFLEVKNIAAQTPDPDAKISLAKVDGKFKLNVSTKSGDKSLDVTNYTDEIIEIEERPALERITISVSGDKFIIKQKGVTAETDYEINIDPQTAGLTLETPTGFRFLSILPRQAVETILRARVISRIRSGERIIITEEGRELAYGVAGEKVINLFNIFKYSVPVSARVSASTGEILLVEQPTWLKLFGFLFV